jgi:outer membrane protein OmpA-like peptidoglycan-associated protein
MCRLMPLMIVAGVALLSGCMNWADAGKGGAGEDYPSADNQATSVPVAYDPRELRQDFDNDRRHLDVLILQGASNCFPASVHLAELRENKIAREIAGELYQDAETTQVAHRRDLQRIERKIKAIDRDTNCWDAIDSPQSEVVAVSQSSVSAGALGEIDDSTVTMAEKLFRLLNSDNQFALNSDQINPKYADNLTGACAILETTPAIKLNVIGHSDASGKADENDSLSFRRARAVVEFLISCDIDAGRIGQSFEGDKTPLYNGRSPAIDLVNRRVSIELLSAFDGSPQ